jgi:hypothetical protein
MAAALTFFLHLASGDPGTVPALPIRPAGASCLGVLRALDFRGRDGDLDLRRHDRYILKLTILLECVLHVDINLCTRTLLPLTLEKPLPCLMAFLVGKLATHHDP